MLEESHCRAIWAALGTGRRFSLEEMAMVTEAPPLACVIGLNRLIRAQYVDMDGFRKAVSGEYSPLFAMTRKAYEPPLEVMLGDGEKPVEPPDLSMWKAKKPYAGKLTIVEVEPPTEEEPVARLRRAAYANPTICKRDDLFKVLGVKPEQRKAYVIAFKSLRRAGEIVETAIRSHYEYQDRRYIFQAAAFMRGHVSQEVTLKQLHAMGIPIEGKNIPGMLKVLAKEYWRASVAYKGRTNTIEWFKIEEKGERQIA